MSELTRYSLEWRRPDLPPPGPRVLIEMIVPRGEPCPPEVEALWKPGAGYAICWSLVTPPAIRRWSQQAKSKVRIGNLRRRIERKFPLFADVFIQAELHRRPGYYADEDHQSREMG